MKHLPLLCLILLSTACGPADIYRPPIQSPLPSSPFHQEMTITIPESGEVMRYWSAFDTLEGFRDDVPRSRVWVKVSLRACTDSKPFTIYLGSSDPSTGSSIQEQSQVTNNCDGPTELPDTYVFKNLWRQMMMPEANQSKYQSLFVRVTGTTGSTMKYEFIAEEWSTTPP